MVELSPFSGGGNNENGSTGGGGRQIMAMSYAGDTFNTAVYLARLGVPAEYCTILGDDPYSDSILEWLAREGIGSDAIARLPGRLPGLYVIRNHSNGEREFSYWRNEAPARHLFRDASSLQAIISQLLVCEYLYLSGITLAIMSPDARSTLLAFLCVYRRQGGRVAFDSNYRPGLWPNPQEAQEVMTAAFAQTDIALLTLDDEQLLWSDGDAESCLSRYQDSGIGELVLKRGAEDTLVVSDHRVQCVPVTPVVGIVDTTGAGDTFNAGYLAARIKGADPVAAVKEGNRCAAIVIRHHGGVIDGDTFLTEYRGRSKAV